VVAIAVVVGAAAPATAQQCSIEFAGTGAPRVENLRAGACAISGDLARVNAYVGQPQRCTSTPCSTQVTLDAEHLRRLQRVVSVHTAIVPTPSGLAQAATVPPESAVAETLQLVGQIVVDRASQAAFDRMAHRLRDWLHCTDADALAPQATSGSFPET